jgi:hypothetical protein
MTNKPGRYWVKQIHDGDDRYFYFIMEGDDCIADARGKKDADDPITTEDCKDFDDAWTQYHDLDRWRQIRDGDEK